MKNKSKEHLKKIYKKILKEKIEKDVEIAHLNRVLELNKLLNFSLKLNDLLLNFSSFLYTIIPFKSIIFYIDENNIYDIKLNNKNFSILKRVDKLTSVEQQVKIEFLNNLNNLNCYLDYLILQLEPYKKSPIFFIKHNPSCFDIDTINLLKNFINMINPYIKNVLHYKKVNDLSNIDSLTNLYNRRFFFNYTEKRSSENYSIILADIDYFKKINDTYGHQAGDEILKKISKEFKTHFRNNDIICRYGGEEFLIYLENTSLETAINIANRIREIIENLNYNNIKFTVSMGVAKNDIKKHNNIDDVIKSADIALYIAKNSGRNRVCYYKEND
ncbi:diguanylate cyclase (GGDEF)-like protein [Hypnocyclicus thermotrophus]|uniref:Diguanylate cyclase (GGDEF)-like protein n=1 Tax=Hypnocyclicus thermotrophus TaxID=1627895 RepID=A0AA46I696_9FUSO|nr:GGDEF domain-containing protein [Hypnocyclicus thermotrophus]TDT71910.1 diguanylate cyclase (GGDEF)-like protein [Hypnocyclicus thermotrophus]